jgi:hypothetical protein
MEEINEFYDEIKENPKYLAALSTNENPVKEFFENDIFKQVEKGKLEITSQQKQQASSLFSEFLDVYLQDYEQVEKILKEENIIQKKCN